MFAKNSKPAAPTDDSRLRKIQLVLPWLVCLLSVLALLSFHVSWWLLDIYVSFLPQIIIVLVTLYVVVFAIYGRFIVRDGWNSCWGSISSLDEFMLISSGLILMFLLASSVLVVGTVDASEREPNLKIGTYNVLYSNPSISGAAEYFKREQVDIIALQEARPEFVEQTRNILGYDYATVSDCDCSAKDTEVAIISKYPIANAETIIQHKNGGVRRAEVNLDANNTLAVYVVHIPPPFSSDWHKLRDSLLSKIENRVQQEELPVVVMGDFNSTIFSPAMQDFINNNEPKINNVSQYSWPKCSWFGFGAVSCARIDHIFVSTDYEIGNRTIGEGFGSDHRPVLVEVVVP